MAALIYFLMFFYFSYLVILRWKMQNQPEVEVTVQYFAISRDISGIREEIVSFPQQVTSRKVFEILVAKHSG